MADEKKKNKKPKETREKLLKDMDDLRRMFNK